MQYLSWTLSIIKSFLKSCRNWYDTVTVSLWFTLNSRAAGVFDLKKTFTNVTISLMLLSVSSATQSSPWVITQFIWSTSRSFNQDDFSAMKTSSIFSSASSSVSLLSGSMTEFGRLLTDEDFRLVGLKLFVSCSSLSVSPSLRVEFL